MNGQRGGSFDGPAPRLRLRRALAALGCAAILAAGALAAGAGATSPGGASDLPLIRGGKVAAEGDLPALAFVAYLIPNGTDEAITCTGTVIAPTVVMTAAHCVHPRGVRVLPENFRVIAGAVAWKPAVDSASRVVKVDTFPRYSESTGAGDVALLELEAPVAVPPLQFASRAFWSAGTKAQEAGWGRTEPKQRVPTYLLHRAATSVLGDAECRYEGRARGQICAKQLPKLKASPCFGDSGGPLLSHRPGDGRLVEIGVLHGGVSGRCSPRFAVTYTSTVPVAHWVRARLREAAG